jgi:hypothetical protein
MHYETMEEALRDLVRALGGSKAIGARLFPSLPLEQAAGRVSDSLNHDRRQQFAPHELLYLLRMACQSGHHAAMHYVCAITGYEQPRPSRDEAELAELQAAFVRATSDLQLMARRIEALSSPNLRSV